MAKKKQLPPGVRERNGRFTFRYDIPDPATGERIQKETPGFSTAKEAYTKGILIQAEILKGTYVAEKDISLKDFTKTYLESREGRVKEKTIRIDRLNLNIASKHLGGMKMKDITKKMCNDMLMKMKKDGYARRTVEMVHGVCERIFRYAMELEVIQSNPMETVKVPAYLETVEDLESGKELPKYLEKEELVKLLKAAKEYGFNQDYVIFSTLAHTGLRVGELCALKWTDVKKPVNQLSVTKTLVEDSKTQEVKIGTPKTKSSKRNVDIGETVISALDRQTSWQKEFKMRYRKTYYDENFIFVSERSPGYPMRTSLVRSRMKRLLELAGLPDTLTPHSLRHTHVSLLAEAGVNLEVIQKRLGHKNDRITREVYLHVTKKQNKEAALKFETLLGDLQA